MSSRLVVCGSVGGHHWDAWVSTRAACRSPKPSSFASPSSTWGHRRVFCGCLVSCCAFFRSATRVAQSTIIAHWQSIVFDYACRSPCTIYHSAPPGGTGQTSNERTYTINYGASSSSHTHGACLDRAGHPVCARSGNASRDTYCPISTQGQHCMPKALLRLFVGAFSFLCTIFLTTVANVISNGHS